MAVKLPKRKTIRTKSAIIDLRLAKLATLTDPKKITTKAVVADLGRNVKEKSLALVKVGLSPVEGRGRFKGYAVQRGGKSNYPEIPGLKKKFPGKKTRPVNLELDGEYLDAVTQYKKNREGDGIEFGLLKGSDLQNKMFESHNEGSRNDIPQRKVIPTNGDDYTPLIRRKIKDIYLNRIRNIIRSALKL